MLAVSFCTKVHFNITDDLLAYGRTLSFPILSGMKIVSVANVIPV